MKRYTIIGAGPVGCSLAILLAKQGDLIDIFDKRDLNSIEELNKGPSISLLISPRGQKTIKEVGIWEIFRKESFLMKGRLRRFPSGKSLFMPYGKKDWINYSIDRNKLSEILFQKAKETEGISIFLNHELKSVGQQCVFDNKGSLVEHPKGSLVIGADGANSKLRELMGESDSHIKVRRNTFSHSYTSLCLPSKNLDKNSSQAINIFPRKDHLIVGMPDSKQTLSCTLVVPNSSAREGFNMKGFIKHSYPDLFSSLEKNNNLNELKFFNLYKNEVSSYYDEKQNFLLIGDAAHTILPFMGQGINLGLEDVHLLSEAICKKKIKLKDLMRERLKEGLAASHISESHYTQIVNSAKEPKFLLINKLNIFLGDNIFNKTPLPVVMLDFKEAKYSDLVPKEYSIF